MEQRRYNILDKTFAVVQDFYDDMLNIILTNYTPDDIEEVDMDLIIDYIDDLKKTHNSAYERMIVEHEELTHLIRTLKKCL